MNSRTLSSLLTTKLREDALKLRKLAAKSSSAQSSLGSIKDRMMREVHLIVTLLLGPPPSPSTTFTWEHYDKDDKFQSVKTTPLQFAGDLSSTGSIRVNSGTDVHELFSLVNDPRNSYGELLSVSRLGNIVGMRGVRYVNVEMEVSLLGESGNAVEITNLDHENRLYLYAPQRHPYLLRQRRWQIFRLKIWHHGYKPHRLRIRLQHPPRLDESPATHDRGKRYDTCNGIDSCACHRWEAG